MDNFVTFEIAKKLKEIGFRENCFAGYDKTGLLIKNGFPIEDAFVEFNMFLQCHNLRPSAFDAPTISQVLKWLREEKGLHIEVRLDSRGFGACINKYDIDTLELISFNPLLNAGFSKTYEEAALVGIEYILDNYN